MSEIKRVTDWMDGAQQKNTLRNMANYFAYMMSELSEGMDSIDVPEMRELASTLEALSVNIRKGKYDDQIDAANKLDLMDSAIDTAWTSIGLAHMLGDATGAFNEIVTSNYSKFVDGVAWRDETGKVIKGPGYFAPDLTPFIHTS